MLPTSLRDQSKDDLDKLFTTPEMNSNNSRRTLNAPLKTIQAIRLLVNVNAKLISLPNTGANGTMAPRAPNISEVNAGELQRALNVMQAIQNGAATILFPQDSQGLIEVFKEELRNNFQSHKTNTPSYNQWCDSYLVAEIIKQYKQENNRKQRVCILSSIVPKHKEIPFSYFQKALDITKQQLRSAIRWANQYGRGFKEGILHTNWKRKDTPKSKYLQRWLSLDANVMVDPSGTTGVKYRRIPQGNAAWQQYRKDAEAASKPFYQPNQFYKHPSQKGVKDGCATAGLCNSCTRYHTFNTHKIEALANAVAKIGEAELDYDAFILALGQYEEDFTNGGPFVCSLKRKSDVIDCCTQHAM